MTDIFENKILCGRCNVQMRPISIAKNGFILRAVECPKCNSKIIHPRDEQEYKEFMELRKKQFNVKMRFVGNSYAVSIPKEIVNFMQEQEKAMDDMVRLSLQEFGRISMSFGVPKNHLHPSNQELKEKINKGELN
jgi:DNA-directed RNA polymerase subunit RPC12/RpoP